MDDEKGLIVFVIVFFLLAAAGWSIANMNQITPIVAEAQAGAAIGGTTVIALEKGASLLLKLLVGAIVTGFAAAVFTEARKAYALWKRSARAGRWTGGPNANFQKQPAEPKLRREDLMLLALGGKYPVRTASRPTVGRTRGEPSDDDLDTAL